MLYDTFSRSIKGRIAITEPTILTATDIPYQICQYNPYTIGNEIGYQTGSISLMPTRGILFMTIGILKQQLINMSDEDICKIYSFILLDEVHIRSIEMDTVLLYLKEFLKRNYRKESCPIIILMSATMDENNFIEYFNMDSKSIIEIKGKTFPIETSWLKYDTFNLINRIADQIIDIHVNDINIIQDNLAQKISKENIKSFQNRDILVFLPDTSSINNLYKKILKMNKNLSSYNRSVEYNKSLQVKYGGSEMGIYLYPIKLTSANIKNNDKNILDIATDMNRLRIENNIPIRRVIFATNAAETGITIDTLKYCIDSGYVNDVSFNPVLEMHVLAVKNISQSSVLQRKGRVGRKSNGYFFPMYSEKTFNALPEQDYPVIVKDDISSLILSIICKDSKIEILNNELHIVTDKIAKLSDMDFLTYPPIDNIKYALNNLYNLNMITLDLNPSIYGMIANKFPRMALENIRTILAAFQYNANMDAVLTICSMLEIKNVYCFPKINIVEKLHAHYRFYSSVDKMEHLLKIIADDTIEWLLVWGIFGAVANKLDINKLNKFFEEFNLNKTNMYAICFEKNELINNLISIGLNFSIKPLDYNNIEQLLEEVTKIKRCLLSGYRSKLCILEDDSYRLISNKKEVNIKSKCLYTDVNCIDQNKPKYILTLNPIFRNNHRIKKYEIISTIISSLDGFIDGIDLNYNIY